MSKVIPEEKPVQMLDPVKCLACEGLREEIRQLEKLLEEARKPLVPEMTHTTPKSRPYDHGWPPKAEGDPSDE